MQDERTGLEPGANASSSTGSAFPVYPWSVLPPRLASRLEPAVPGLAELLVREISTNVPQYQGRRSERFWTGIREGVEQSLHAFLQLIGQPRGPDPQLRAIVRGLGRNEHEAGRTLDALQMAYRIGARHSWRTWASLIAQEQLTTEQVTAFAESTFAFVDELAAESVAGYTESQAAAASEQPDEQPHGGAEVTAARVPLVEVERAQLRQVAGGDPAVGVFAADEVVGADEPLAVEGLEVLEAREDELASGGTDVDLHRGDPPGRGLSRGP